MNVDAFADGAAGSIVVVVAVGIAAFVGGAVMAMVATAYARMKRRTDERVRAMLKRGVWEDRS